jgi:hypothetical protein
MTTKVVVPTRQDGNRFLGSFRGLLIQAPSNALPLLHCEMVMFIWILFFMTMLRFKENSLFSAPLLIVISFSHSYGNNQSTNLHNQSSFPLILAQIHTVQKIRNIFSQK